MLYGEQNCKIQHNTINVQNTNENTTNRATNEDKFSKNTTSGNVGRLNAGEGRRRRQNKRRRRSLIRLGWTLTHVGHIALEQGCIFRLTCSHPELTEDRVLTSAFVKIFRTVARYAVNKSVWREKDCSWLPLNKHAMNISENQRTGKHLHVLHVLRIYSTCSHPGW